MPRIFMPLCRADELELHAELDVVAESEAAAGKRGVPVEPVRRAVDDCLELEPDALVPYGSFTGPLNVPRIATGSVTPLIVSSP